MTAGFKFLSPRRRSGRMLEGLNTRCRRHGGPAAAPRRSRQRPREREHDRLQARPRRLPRPRSTTRPAARRPRACAPATAPPPWTPASRSSQGALQRTDRPLDVADPGRGLPPHPPRRRPPGADARRQPPARRPRPPRHPHRRARAADDHRPRGHRRGPALDRLRRHGQRRHPAHRPPRRRHRALPAAAHARSATTPSSPRPPPATPSPRRAATTLAQGALEMSNVDMSPTRWSTMIESQRAYQLASKAISDRRPDVADRQRGEAMNRG